MKNWQEYILEASRDQTALLRKWQDLRYGDGTIVNVDEQGIVRQFIPSCLGVEFHEKMETGTTLRALQYKHLHLAYWETPYYCAAIESALQNVNIADEIILDLGCGDGRFTELLIKLGARRIVATDCNLSSLASLAAFAEEKGFADCLLLIHSGADTLKVRFEAFGIIIAMGVLYYLNEHYESGLSHAVALLKKGGHFIASEPDFEGAAFKALIFEGLEDYIDLFEQGYFSEIDAGETFKFRAFTKEEIQNKYRENGLEVLNSYCLSLLPSLLRIGMVRGHYTQAHIAKFESRIRESFDYFNKYGQLPKHIIWHCRKGW